MIVVIAVLALGVVGTSIGLVQANRQRVAAEQARADAQHEADTTKAINDFLKDMIGAVNALTMGSMPLRAPATEATVRELLMNATGGIEEHFADRPELESGMRETLSSALFSLGQFDEGEAQLLAAYEGEMTMRGEAHKNTRQVIEHLAHLYEMWDKLEQAAQWRAKLPTASPVAKPL